MRKSTSGFTIVELLIVIVVIGVLAAIVVVAYNGITTSSKNTKTVSAVSSWVKALQLYKAQNGDYPTQNSCLGKTTTYTGNGLCWDGTSWDIDANFLAALAPFIGSQPEPDITPVSTVNTQRRGAFHYNDTGLGVHRIYMMLSGVSTCPAIGGLTLTDTNTETNGVHCRYILD